MDFVKKFLNKLGILSGSSEKLQSSVALENLKANGKNVVPRDAHGISRKNIHTNALKVLYRLSRNGYDAYLVGGCVRDLLLGLQPKDFDVATNATPEQVKSLFVNCRLIGRRFRLAHIHFGKDIIEVATFRAQATSAAKAKDSATNEQGMIVRDNVYGTIEEDAVRRDFTINALYYNIKDFTVIDYVGGLTDLEEGVIKMIGDPAVRYQEDPVRMLRAIRFAAKLNLDIEASAETYINEHKEMLGHVPPARLFEEIRKLFLMGHASKSFQLLLEHNLFGEIFDQAYACLLQEGHGEQTLKLLECMFADTDKRVQQGKSVTPVFLFVGLLWTSVQKQARHFNKHGYRFFPALERAIEKVMSHQLENMSMPKHFVYRIKETWVLQHRLTKRDPSKVMEAVKHPSFRASYDLLLLRARSGEKVQHYADWWTDFQKQSQSGKKVMVAQLEKPTKN